MSRWILPVGALVLLAGCGAVKKYLPAGPVLSAAERAAYEAAPSGVRYTSPPAVEFPVIPIQVWGAHYDLDLVLETVHDRYDMHEYARIDGPDGPIWLAKDALSATKTQSLVADIDDLHTWAPELPIERKSSPVTVDDQSTPDRLDLTIRYENLEGEPVVVHYEGKVPSSAQKKRNGNTMGHSANVAMAVLNIPYRDFAKRASVEIDGEDYRIRKLLGLVGLKVALVQTQGGLSVTELVQTSDDQGVTTTIATPDGDVVLPWNTVDHGDTVELRQDADLRTLSYTFLEGDDSYELSELRVLQYGIDQPIVTIALTPALPDLRRGFDGRHTSRFVVDIDDQPGHAVGELEAFWEGDVVRVLLHPTEPDWVTDRPMQTTIRYSDETAAVEITRVPVDPG